MHTTIKQFFLFLVLSAGLDSYLIAGQVIQTVEAEAALVSPTLTTSLISNDNKYGKYSGWAIDSGSSLVIYSSESIAAADCPRLTFSGLTPNTEYTICAWITYAPGITIYTSPLSTLGWKLRYSFNSNTEAASNNAALITPANLLNPGFRSFQWSAMNRYLLGVKRSDAGGKIDVWLGKATYGSALQSAYIGWDKFDIISVDGRTSDWFPSPEEVYIDANTTLKWMKDYRATKHDVYVGDDYDYVLNAGVANVDKDNNNFIDMNDLAFFVQDWLCNTPPCLRDLNNDNNTNFVDFSIFAHSWLKRPIYRGRVAATELAISDLSDGVYYWRIDEVNDSNLVLSKGDVKRFTVGRYNVRPEDYGAVGNGTTDDTNAFNAASQAIENASGGQLVLTGGKTYRVGQQYHVAGQYPYYQAKPIFSVHNAYKRKTTILGNGATMKANDGLRYGCYDKDTGAIYNPTTWPFYDSQYEALAYWGMLQMENCFGVEIHNINLDGNIDNLNLGGHAGYSTGYECAAYGIYLNKNDNVTIYDVNSSFHGLDGIMIAWPYLTASDPPKPHYLENVKCYYNGRQGMSIVGGNKFTVVKSKFNHTGKRRFCTSPGYGLDIEAESSIIRNAQFTGCDFVNNQCVGAGAGNSAVQNVADVNFTDCLFWGTTSMSIYGAPPRFTFTDCNIYGVAYALPPTSDNPALNGSPNNEAVKFFNCHFEDYTGTYEGVQYSSCISPYMALLVFDGNGITLEGCKIYANAIKACYFSSDGAYSKEILKNCDIYHKYGALTTGNYQSVFVDSYLENVRFHESDLGTNNYRIQLYSVIVGPGVTVDGPQCKWAGNYGLTGSIPLGYMYQDNFEIGNFNGGNDQGGWTTQNGNAAVTTGAKYAGAYGAKLASITWIQKTLSTAGFASIHVKYNRTTTGMAAGENLYVEWSTDGTTWNNLETTQDTTWAAQDMTCGSGADNNANFRIRFRTNGSTTSKYAYVDDLIVTGTKQ